ncbi:MAG: DNA repair protein RadC [Parcubacteria group bacterium]|nr:DNA repair protein RadC [Parcubacteria group bacterium]
MPKKLKISEIPLVDRPREKMKAKGAQNLKDAELLAILLGTGYQGKNVIELAKSILSKYPRKKFISVDYDELIKTKGISQAKACKILSAIELTKRFLKFKDDETLPVIKSVKDVVAQSVYMRDKKREHFQVLFLNARNEMIFKRHMFVGTLNANLVHPREIFEEAVKQQSASIILVHNHPSSDPEPSQDDIEVTKRLVEAGKIMGIEILDHIIIAKGKVFSFKEKGLI